MWTREELKTRAKQGLKKYYWYGLLVVFVAGLLGGNAAGGVSSRIGSTGASGVSGGSPFYHYNFNHMTREDVAAVIGIMMIFLSIFLVAFLVSLAFGVFVSNVVAVGKCRYFLLSTGRADNAGFEELFGMFKKGRYMNTVKAMFFRHLFEFLWSLLLIIPGVIKHYEYYMVPYLVAENPDMEWKEAFRLSKEMMNGSKFSTWVLELSFLGWYLLGFLACCIGTIFVAPYAEATFAELYLKLKEIHYNIPRYAQPDPYADPYAAGYTDANQTSANYTEPVHADQTSASYTEPAAPASAASEPTPAAPDPGDQNADCENGDN